ncbi:MAG: hypothetical protein ACRD35_00890 [Candidatus Acidiferrales bacterium]
MSQASDLSGQLANAAAQIRDLEQAMKSHQTGLDIRLLIEFRQAVDQIRLTTWAMQKWIDLRGDQKNLYGALALLMAERIRRATELNNELARDLKSIGMVPETTGMTDLRIAVERLLQCLEPLTKEPGK